MTATEIRTYDPVPGVERVAALANDAGRRQAIVESARVLTMLGHREAAMALLERSEAIVGGKQ